LLKRIDVQLAKAHSQDTALLGSESLDRQSYARLRVTFARSRQRRAQRIIRHEPQTVMLGHKSICAHLHLEAAKVATLAAENESDSDSLAAGYAAMNKTANLTDQQDQQNWVLVNQSTQGVSLYSPHSRAGNVQVGELVSMESHDGHLDFHTTGKSAAMIGMVRWVIANEGSAIRIGVEFLAKGVLPVGISRTHSDDIVADDAMIIACKVKESVLQTILLPAYLYQTGDRLTVTLNGKSRGVRLHKSLQNNGLFSHFSLADV